MSEQVVVHLFWAIASKRLEKHPMIRIAKMIDWQPVVHLLAEIIKAGRQRKGGRRPYGPMLMFRALLLGEWYGLSYQQLEKALKVRIDFLLFCGFDAFEDLPDASTLNRFALRVYDLDLPVCPFALVKDQMQTKGIEIVPTVGALKDPRVRFRGSRAW